jgi:hypothetical protein
MNTTSQLTTSVQPFEGLPFRVQYLSFIVDLNTTHGEVQDWLHIRNMKRIVDVERKVVEELLPKGSFFLPSAMSL